MAINPPDPPERDSPDQSSPDEVRSPGLFGSSTGLIVAVGAVCFVMLGACVICGGGLAVPLLMRQKAAVQAEQAALEAERAAAERNLREAQETARKAEQDAARNQEQPRTGSAVDRDHPQ